MPADTADPVQQQEDADQQAGRCGTDDEPGRTGRGRGRGDLVTATVALLLGQEIAEVGADRLIRGRQPGGQRPGRMGAHAGRAEQIPDRVPLPDELFEFRAFGRGIPGVQPLDVGELRVGRGQDGRVQRIEQPSLLIRAGGQECLFAGVVSRVHVPGELAGRGRGGQLVVSDVVSQPG